MWISEAGYKSIISAYIDGQIQKSQLFAISLPIFDFKWGASNFVNR